MNYGDEGAASIAITALMNVLHEHDVCTEVLRRNVGTTESAAFIQSARYETIACEALSRLGALSHVEALDRMTRTAAALSAAITILREDTAEARGSNFGDPQGGI